MTEAEKSTNFLENYEKHVKEAFDKGGINGFHSFVVQNLDQWKHVPLNIAVTGNSGTGKSSFINTLKNTNADDNDGAKSDVVQCMTGLKSYVHPKNKNLILWDLPGVGTTDFPKETYLQQVKFERYDCFMIISASRFTQNDLWLAKAINSKNKSPKKDARKSFYFVRTKVDNDLSVYKKGRSNPEPEHKLLERIREESQAELKTGGFPTTPIYLIENYAPSKYDFVRLAKRLVEESPAEKKEAMALSLPVLTDEIINSKEEALKERVPKICLMSACGGAVPIPGLSAVIDGALLIEEASFYREQLGLNEEGLELTAKLLQIPLEDLGETLDLKSLGFVLTIRGLMTLCSDVVFTKFIESSAKVGIPVLGSVISAGVSYYSTQYILQTLLTSMVEEAKKINKHVGKMLNEEVKNP